MNCPQGKAKPIQSQFSVLTTTVLMLVLSPVNCRTLQKLFLSGQGQSWSPELKHQELDQNAGILTCVSAKADSFPRLENAHSATSLSLCETF